MQAAREKRCPVCKNRFAPFNSLQKACGQKCALELVRIQSEKKARAERISYAKENRTKPELTKIAQKEFNRYIRVRDDGLPCISCGELNPGGHERGGKWDCGHYQSVGSTPELRFEPLNAHRQCKRCNSHLGGNIVNYRKGLIDRIGLDKLDWLEGSHAIPKRTHQDLREIADYFKREANKLNSQIKG